MRLIPILFAVVLFGCNDESSGGSSGVGFSHPTPIPVYQSSDLGQLAVAGAPVEARVRFTFNADEYPVAVHVSGQYVPMPGNTVNANAEVALYDTKADSDPLNDVLIGFLPPSPFSRARLDPDVPGSFSIVTPIGAAAAELIGPQVETIGVRLRVSTNSWHGTVTAFQIKVVTLKHITPEDVSQSFLRDQ